MRLSNEAKDYVRSLYSQKMDEVSKNPKYDLGQIHASFHQSPGSAKYQKLNQVSAEKFRELVMARAQAYIAAYKLDGRLLDEAEVKEIAAELTHMADVHVGHALIELGYESQFSGLPAGLSERFKEDLKERYNEAAGEAISELRRAMTHTALIEKGKARYQVLLEIYGLTKDDRQSPINFNRLRPVADPNRHELNEAIAYLRDEGLVEQNGMFVSITYKGVREVEQAISNPQRPTEHFQPAVIQYFQAPIYGGVQAGDQGNVQNISVQMDLERQASTLVVPQAISSEKDGSITDFTFISDQRIRTIVERDYQELNRLDAQFAPKSILILSGGIIEGILTDAIITKGTWDFDECRGRQLKDLIYRAKTDGIIVHDTLADVIKAFRNLVHPAREIKDSVDPNLVEIRP
jgi:hypothetical protein